MPVGDSITLGYNDTGAAGYRGYLYTSLTAVSNSFQFVGTTTGAPGALPANQQGHDGWSGWTTGDVNGTQQSSFNDGKSGNIGTWMTQLTSQQQTPTDILLMIGTNDPVRGAGTPTQDIPGTVANATSNLSSIIDKACSADPGRRSSWRRSRRRPARMRSTTVGSTVTTRAFPPWSAQKQGLGDNITLVDMNAIPAGDIGGDGLHPNDAGYQWIAGQWYTALAEQLSRRHGGDSGDFRDHRRGGGRWTSTVARPPSAPCPAAATSRWEAATDC